MEVIIFAFFGVLLNILRKLSELERFKERFSIAVWINKNLFKTIFSLLASIIIAFALKNQISNFDAIFLGFTIDAFMKTKAKAFLNKY